MIVAKNSHYFWRVQAIRYKFQEKAMIQQITFVQIYIQLISKTKYITFRNYLLNNLLQKLKNTDLG